MPTTNYIWDPVNDSYLMETDELGNTAAVYTNEPDQYGPLISQRRGGATNYYHYDGLGSTRQLTNSAEGVTDTYLNSAFGEEVAKTGTTVNPFRFVGALGYYYDDDLASNYVRERVYAPPIARWTAADPVSFTHPGTQYSYVLGNPINRVDPSGLQPQPNCAQLKLKCLIQVGETRIACLQRAQYICGVFGLTYLIQALGPNTPLGPQVAKGWGSTSVCLIAYMAACDQDYSLGETCCNKAHGICAKGAPWPGFVGSWWFTKCLFSFGWL